MSKLLLAHFRAMQGRVGNYLQPGPYYEAHGPASAAADDQLAQDTLFIHDMIYDLDGPEQRKAQEHAEFDYLAESERTASGHYHGELVSFEIFRRKLSNFIEAAEELDRYKKLMFYGEDAAKGRTGDQPGGERGERLIRGVVNMTEDGPWVSEDQAEFIVHAVLGIATEAGELAEALFKTAVRFEEGDRANFLEEVGDLQWYEAMLARVFGTDFDAIQRTNIAKLRARFPDKFTSDKANNRDLSAERVILEDGQAPLFPDDPDMHRQDTAGRVQTQFEGLADPVGKSD